MRKPRRWLLLAHHLPPKAAYLRVKLWRGLRELGAVPLKHALYVLPVSQAGRDGFRRLLKELQREGGEGAICEASFVEGMADRDIELLFQAARQAEYQKLAAHLRGLLQRKRGKDRSANLKLKVEKARQEMRQIAARDLFAAKGQDVVEQLLSQLEHDPILRTEPADADKSAMDSLTNKIWVTRRDVHVDRIACAWLIRRFVDPEARFVFVSERRHKKARGRLGFDMAGGEFTHEGDKCSFEVLAERVRPADAALGAIAEIIHDLDLKDGKFGRRQTGAIGQAIENICASGARDLDRIAGGICLFDKTYEGFRKTRA